jgi:hypothetical protein
VSKTATVDIISTVAELLSPHMSIYPQPARDELFISGIGDADRITIVDVLGRIHMQHWITGNAEPVAGDIVMLDVSTLPSGVYHLRIYRNGVVTGHKQFVLER